jgi:uncharacterized SAM-binding protein YcdF (DUF218 family)
MRRRIHFRRVRRILLIVFGAWLLLAFIIGIVVTIYGQTDRAQPADVIIVLGSGLRRDLQPGPALTRRSARGAALWQAGYAPMIICSGGYATWSTARSEADGCAQVLRENGVPAEAIIIEDRSRSTEENAVYSHEIMRERGWNTALIVSDGYHLLRATWIFSVEGITFSTSRAAPPPLIDGVTSTAREVVALHWQVVKTVLGLPYTFVPWL